MPEIKKFPSTDYYNQLVIEAGTEIHAAILASGEYPRDVFMRYVYDPTSPDGETFRTWAEDHYAIPQTSQSWLAREVKLIFEESPWVLPLDVEIVPVQQQDFSVAA